MKASKILHKDIYRIKLEFAYESIAIAKIKTIRGYAWSKTQNAWLIPYNKEAYTQLLKLYPSVEIVTTEIKATPIKESKENEEKFPIETIFDDKLTYLTVLGRKIIVKTPKNNLDTFFLSTIRYSHWDKKQFVWVVPHFGSNLELIKNHFTERIGGIDIHETFTTEQGNHTIANNEVLCLLVGQKRLRLIFGLNKNISYQIKKIPFHIWDAQNKWWTVPYSEKILQQLKDVVAEEKYTFTYHEEASKTERKPRISPFDIPNYRYCPQEFKEKLKELRYSDKTLKTYSDLFEEYINYHHQLDFTTIGEAEITAYLRHLVSERKVSISYQNQAINAIKFYYERVLGGQRKLYMIDRPRRERSLPTVLSEEEVLEIFKKIDNLKHKTMMLVTYSAGLRISELVNLKVKDIDAQRMQIKITQGKGKKDRYTLLSTKALDYLRRYAKEYKPKDWLFEGVDGGQYANRSAQQVLKTAVKKTSIIKTVSMHTLRHSFATHLLEQGTDLRYIQSLLGHESSRTTEIYTHITTKGFDQIKSPLDKLDI